MVEAFNFFFRVSSLFLKVFQSQFFFFKVDLLKRCHLFEPHAWWENLFNSLSLNNQTSLCICVVWLVPLQYSLLKFYNTCSYTCSDQVFKNITVCAVEQIGLSINFSKFLKTDILRTRPILSKSSPPWRVYLFYRDSAIIKLYILVISMYMTQWFRGQHINLIYRPLERWL